jgi:glucose/arabinose dehydrogenase
MARQYRGRILRLQSLFPGGPPGDYAHREMQHRLGTLLRHRPVPPRGWRCLLPLVLLAATAAHAQSVPDSFTVETLAPGLSAPTGFDFLPDGRVLFVEQFAANVRVFKEATGVQASPVLSVAGVAIDGGERGLLGVAVDPEFPQRPYLYLHYTVASPHHIRIARYTLSGDLTGTGIGTLVADPASRYDLIDDIPDVNGNHNGGTVRFGSEGLLYASIGEDGVPCAAQDSISLRGVILRLVTRDLPPGPGSAFRAQITPADNPFYAYADSNLRLVAALGLRNPFRFQIDAPTGQLVIGDVGENVREEVDLLSPAILYALARPFAVSVAGASLGADFGWPYMEGTLPGPNPNACGPIPSGLTAPVFDYDRTLQNGAAIISAGASRPFQGKSRSWPVEYSGDLFASDYYSGDLRRLRYANGAWGIAPAVPGQPAAGLWGTGFGAVSDWRLGPDGALWYCRQSVGGVANTGSLARISGPGLPPAGVGPPTVAPLSLTLKNSPARGTARLGVIVGDGPVTLRILDLGGRAIRTLLDRAVPHVPGGTEYTVVWDGMTGDGVAARPGVYVAQLEAEGRRAGLRIPFLR